jgi:hypothetical protein
MPQPCESSVQGITCRAMASSEASFLTTTTASGRGDVRRSGPTPMPVKTRAASQERERRADVGGQVRLATVDAHAKTSAARS